MKPLNVSDRMRGSYVLCNTKYNLYEFTDLDGQRYRFAWCPDSILLYGLEGAETIEPDFTGCKSVFPFPKFSSNPRAFVLQTTHRCNLACKYCFVSGYYQDLKCELVFEETDTPQNGRDLEEVSLLVSNGKSNKPEEALLCPFFDRAGDRLDFSFSTWERFLRQIQLVEHRLRKYEKGRGNDLRLLRKALYFVGFYGIDWIGSVVAEARKMENLRRKEVLNFFSDKEVSDWIANLWDVRN